MKRAKIPSGLFRATTALIPLCILPACYTFQAIQPTEAVQGEEVQLVLSGPATRGITPSAMMGETMVQGEFLDLTDDSVSLSVWIGQAYRGTPFEPARQGYTFPRVELVRIERRQLSKPRTALTTLGVLAGVYLLIDRVILLEDPNPRPGSEPEDPPPIPLFFRFFLH